jgi:hypothetical protein
VVLANVRHGHLRKVLCSYDIHEITPEQHHAGTLNQNIGSRFRSDATLDAATAGATESLLSAGGEP